MGNCSIGKQNDETTQQTAMERAASKKEKKKLKNQVNYVDVGTQRMKRFEPTEMEKKDAIM